MFERNEKGRLVFKRLDFEIFIEDIFKDISPENMDDLQWMTKRMIESIQLCAYEHAQENENIEEEWEDVFYPA